MPLRIEVLDDAIATADRQRRLLPAASTMASSPGSPRGERRETASALRFFGTTATTTEYRMRNWSGRTPPPRGPTGRDASSPPSSTLSVLMLLASRPAPPPEASFAACCAALPPCDRATIAGFQAQVAMVLAVVGDELLEREDAIVRFLRQVVRHALPALRSVSRCANRGAEEPLARSSGD